MNGARKADAYRVAGFEIPDASLERLAGISTEQRLERDEFLFHRGDPGESLHVVVEGTLQAVSTSFEGQDLVFGEFGPGGVIGELTILDGSARSSSVRAMRTTKLLTVARPDFLALAREDADVAIGIGILCAKVARELSLWAEAASFSDTVGQLATLLVRLTEGDESTAPRDGLPRLRVTQQSLADQLGITRESTNKALRSLEHEGLVSLGRGSVTLTDPEELAWRTTV